MEHSFVARFVGSGRVACGPASSEEAIAKNYSFAIGREERQGANPRCARRPRRILASACPIPH